MNKPFEPQQHKFYLVWIPLEGDFAKSMDYKGPWGSLPFFVTPDLDGDSHKQGNLNLWQLQQGMVYCWDKEPNGAKNIPKESRRQILNRLGEQHKGQDLMVTVGAVNGHMLDMISFDAGISCAINGLDICGGDPYYAKLFINTTITYTPMLSESTAKAALKAILTAASRLTKKNCVQSDFELVLCAKSAALAVLGDKQDISNFCSKTLSAHNFTNKDCADFTSDICLQPGAPLQGTFIRLAHLLRSTLGSRRVPL